MTEIKLATTKAKQFDLLEESETHIMLLLSSLTFMSLHQNEFLIYAQSHKNMSGSYFITESKKKNQEMTFDRNKKKLVVGVNDFLY